MSKKEVSNSRDSDARGDVYEYLLSKLATAGVNGQFRTPRHIIPSLTLCRTKNSHNPSIYQGCGCFRFCIDMYYF